MLRNNCISVSASVVQIMHRKLLATSRLIALAEMCGADCG